MAYTHIQHEIAMRASGGVEFSATATGNVADWTPGIHPHIIRACAIIPTTTGGDYTGAQWKFQHIGLASGSTASDIATLNAVATDKPGHVIYKSGLNVKVTPGQKVILNVSNSATGADANFRAVMFVEPTWEEPANNTGMRATT